MTQLREPKFLEGRHAVADRIFRLSCVLAGLAFLAGFVPDIAQQSLIGLWLIPPGGYAQAYYLSKAATAVLLTVTLIPLYSRWQGHSVMVTVARMLLTGWLLTIPIRADEGSQRLLLETYTDICRLFHSLYSTSTVFPAPELLLLWLGLSLSFFRRSLQWIACTLLSLAGVLMAGPLETIAEYVLNSKSWSVGDPRAGNLLIGLLRAAAFGQSLAMVAVPWGLPWWYAPPKTSATATSDRPTVPREIWLLDHHQSVLSRAAWVSVALGGLGFVAGCLGGALAIITSIGLENAPLPELMFAALVSAFIGTLTLLVACPYWYLLGISVPDILLRGCGFMALAVTSVTWFLTSSDWAALQPMLEMMNTLLATWVGKWAGPEFPVELLLVTAMVCLSFSLANFCRSWNWAASTLLSLLSVPLLIPLVALDFGVAEALPGGWWAIDLVPPVLLMGQTTALLFVPWGLPLWFPPKQAGRITSTDFRDS